MPCKYVTMDLFDERTKWMVQELKDYMGGDDGVLSRLRVQEKRIANLEGFKKLFVQIGSGVTVLLSIIGLIIKLKWVNL